MNNVARSQETPVYHVSQSAEDDAIIARALAILTRRSEAGTALTSPNAAKDYLIMRAAGLQHEVFGCMWLDSQNRIITCEDMFRGTLTQTSIYPREVVKRALELNAGAVILTHNHPSGVAEPSRADENLTQTLKSALALIDVRILDHIITAGGKTVSMAELGLV